MDSHPWVFLLGWFLQLGGMESDAVCCPVNRWIVSGEPAVSQYDHAVGIEGRDIEVHVLLLPGRKAYVQFNCLHDYGVTGAINKTESDGRLELWYTQPGDASPQTPCR